MRFKGIPDAQNKPIFIDLLAYPAVSGRHVFCGVRQSIPSSNIASCADDIDTLPFFADGQTNLPRSSRLENRHAPLLIPPDDLDQITTPSPKDEQMAANGSSDRVVCTCAASVLKPRRMSVTPAASHTRVLLGNRDHASSPLTSRASSPPSNCPRP